MVQTIIKVILGVVMLLMLILVSIVLLVTPVNAQTNDPLSKPVYFVAGDENDIPQVFQFVVGSEQQARQITQSETGVIRFSVAYDGLGIVYTDAGQLWLQSIHTDKAEALAILDTFNLWRRGSERVMTALKKGQSSWYGIK